MQTPALSGYTKPTITLHNSGEKEGGQESSPYLRRLCRCTLSDLALLTFHKMAGFKRHLASDSISTKSSCMLDCNAKASSRTRYFVYHIPYCPSIIREIFADLLLVYPCIILKTNKIAAANNWLYVCLIPISFVS